MMRHLFFLLMTTLSICNLNAQESVKKVIDQLPTWENLPFYAYRSYPEQYMKQFKRATFSKEYGESLIYAWSDLQCKVKTVGDINDGSFFAKFIPYNKKYVVMGADMFTFDEYRNLLFSYTNTGEQIDYIESAVGGLGIIEKQFVIDNNKENNFIVTVYERKPTSLNKITFLELVESKLGYEGQRIDTTYEIDDTGHFKQVSQVKYQPRYYTFEEITDENFNIWDGKETPLQE